MLAFWIKKMKALNPSLKYRVPQIRCYKCGDEEIVEICHHCGRAMCKLHKQSAIPWWIGGKHAEFTELGLKRHPAGDEGKHCQDCLHFSLKWKFWVSLGAILGFIMTTILIHPIYSLPLLTTVKLLVLGLLFGSILGLLWVIIRNEKKRLQHRPPLPIMGQLMYIKAEENIKGIVTLDKEGTYHTSMRSRLEPGTIEIKLKLNSLDRSRMQKYKQKYTLTALAPLPIHAGFLILHGKPNIKIQGKGNHANSPPHTVALKGTARGNAFLMGNRAGNAAEWSQKYDYTFHQLPPKVGEALPIQIIPRVVRQGDGWSLELLVQFTPGMGMPKLLEAKVTIKELIMNYTPMWGDPESTNDPLIFKKSGGNNLNSSLTWKEIKIPNEKVIEKTKAGDEKEEKQGNGDEQATNLKKEMNQEKDLQEEVNRKKSFIVRFQRSISPQMVEEPITGHLKLRFNYALSGIRSLSYHYPTGKKHDLKKVKKELYTNVTINFELDLRSLCFQKPYSPILPVMSPEPNEVPPNYLMVKKLSDKLAEDRVYVQRIIENEPRTNKASAKIINRYWRMEGRKYVGVYPIDFHIIITGREHYADDDVPYTGQTFCETKIFAMVFNDEMRCKVLDFANQLEVIIKYILSKRDIDKDDFDQAVPPSDGRLPQQPLTDLPSNGKNIQGRQAPSSPLDDQPGAAYFGGVEA